MTFKVGEPLLQMVTADNSTVNLSVGVENHAIIIFDYVGNNGCTVNLPSASEASAGYVVDIWHRGSGGNVTSNRNGADIIFTFDRQSITSESAPAGNRRRFISDGNSTWYSANN
jgi:hypothetical protein